MSGPLVPMVGGPLDGQEHHLVTYRREQELLFEAGPTTAEGGEVHVYRSLGGRAPFRYEGTRQWVPNVDVVLPNPAGYL